MNVEIPVSVGELVDKVSILSIKVRRIREADKRANVKREYALLLDAMRKAGVTPRSADFRRLLAINRKLWDIEDAIRLKEQRREFDRGFVALARSVYRNNDLRAAVKRRINLRTGSALVEEKSYAGEKV